MSITRTPLQKVFVLLSITLLVTGNLFATTWLVGPTRTDTMPSQVSGLVQDGDTVMIDAGVYNSDVALWNANNLLLKGTGGMAHLKANGQNYGGKAIWVINGNNTIIDSVEFSLCSCVDHNGAGIRQQGTNLTARHCYFHDNEDGILTTADSTSDILIEHTEFYNNGFGDGYSHNLYIGNIHSLTFRYNYTHHANVGHELKSRAAINYLLYNRFADEATGTASRDIDLPNGGLAIIIGNEIEKGPQAQNSNIMEFGLEGLINPGPQQMYVINNTFVNDKTNGSFLDIKTGTALCKAYNNIFAGPGTVLIVDSTTAIDSANNFYTTVANAGFMDAANYDYHLLDSSPAIDNGVNPGSAGVYNLTPTNEYVHPLGDTTRAVVGVLDIGAHEYGEPATSVSNYPPAPGVSIYPNPSNGHYVVNGLPTGKLQLQLFDQTGQLIFEQETNINFSGKATFNNNDLSSGIYLLVGKSADHSFTRKLLIQQ